MDERLLAWGRAVKQKLNQRQASRRRFQIPVLWLFTDTARLPDPLSAIARLPRGLCGVVFRHDNAPGRAALAAAVSKLCRKRGLDLIIAGDTRLAAALRAGVHLRAGRWPGLVRTHTGLISASVHNLPELRRATRAGVNIMFISPAFATASHPGQAALGALRWVNLARRAPPGKAYALGGVQGRKIVSLAGFCCGAAAIDALKTDISQ